MKEAPEGWKWELVPDYPTGTVVGHCICGSWPGGECLRCPPTETAKSVAKSQTLDVESLLSQAERVKS